MGFLHYSFRANGIGLLCSGYNPVAPETQMLTLFMEFLDAPNERYRLLNFNAECNFGRFSGEYFDFPEEVAAADLFARPILFEVLVLTDDGTEDNHTPFGLDYIIQGVD